MLTLVLLSLPIFGVDTSGVIQRDFHVMPGCESGWKSTDHVFLPSTTTSTITCCLMCGRTHGCSGVNVCVKHGGVSCGMVGQAKTCADLNPSSACRYLQRTSATQLLASTSCENGGTWTGTACNCVWGYAGVRCERFVRSCREAKQLGVSGKAFYSIQPFGSPVAYTVYCNCVYSGTIWPLRRKVPPTGCTPINFNLTWQQYRNGFGDIDCEYFVGLETMYQLSKYAVYNYDLYNILVDVGVTAVRVMQATLKSEAENYELDFENVVSKAPEYADDAIDDSQKPRRFCTWDRDCGGCAGSVGGGWWFTSDCKGGALTVPRDLMTWPVYGVQKAIKLTFFQMDLQEYR